MKYRREIDGLRAIAVLPVILFHAGFGWFPGGYVGVDVFFVISGYLITTILIDELERGEFSIVGFYERRARRILPALYVMLACTAVAGWMTLVPSQLEELSRSIASVVFFASNIHFWQSSDYFAPVAELNPLLHTWSLGVEEQFYILFPIFLLVVWRFGRGPAFWTLVALAAVSLLLSEWGARNAPVANFFLLPTRAWELGAGAICAFVLRDAAPRPSAALSGLGLGLIALSIFSFDALTPIPSLYALAPVGGAALIILYASPSTPVGRLLSMKAFVGIGLISYSAYLVHQPLFAFARLTSLGYPTQLDMALLSIGSLALGYLSWRFVERPFRRQTGRVLPSRGAIFAASAVAGGALAGVGVYGVASDGRSEAWMAAHPQAAVYAMIDAASEIEGVYLDDGGCRFNTPVIDATIAARIRACRERLGPGLAIFGDSHAIDFYNGLHELNVEPFVVGLTFGGCGLVAPPNCDLDAFLSVVSDPTRPFSRVLYHEAAYRYIRSWRGEGIRGVFEDIPEHGALGPDVGLRPDQPNANALDYLKKVAAVADLTWIGPRIEPHIGIPFLLRGGCEHVYALRGGQEALQRDLDRHLAGQAAAAGIPYVSLIEAVDFDMATDFLTCDRIYWRDGDHWSLEGSRLFVARFLARHPIT